MAALSNSLSTKNQELTRFYLSAPAGRVIPSMSETKGFLRQTNYYCRADIKYGPDYFVESPQPEDYICRQQIAHSIHGWSLLIVGGHSSAWGCSYCSSRVVYREAGAIQWFWRAGRVLKAI